MIGRRTFTSVLLAVLASLAAGCTPGGFIAGRILRAPNRQPEWVAPDPRVYLDFNPRFVEGLPRRSFDAPGLAPLADDPARLSYRIVPPAAYHLVARVTNHVEGRSSRPEYHFDRAVPAPPLAGLKHPQGTVVLLHGYGLSQGSMLPWAFWCGDRGWRTILVDLRGHGRSTGRRISFGPVEVAEIQALLQHLDQPEPLPRPIVVLGMSYGGALALRWAASSPAIHSAVALAPYPRLGPAAERLRADFAPAFPSFLLRQAMASIPRTLAVPPQALDTIASLQPRPPRALLVASDADVIAPPRDVEELHAACGDGSALMVVHGVSHEELMLRLDLVGDAVERWLDHATGEER
ncbi:MAG: alpha/beta fold hydrolase [Verrucomicrobiota bacterium]|jgi:pimeloyl-ACP methyl ester carboxylesterase